MIGIRADANETVATGHMMRCITIGKELQALGEEVIFFTAEEYGVPLLAQAGMQYRCLGTRWDQMEAEVPLLLAAIRATGCKMLLVDSYQVTKAYLGALAQECKLAYLDDLFNDVYPVDLIINYNAYHTRFPYREAYGRGTVLLLGPQFVPLRKEFSRLAAGKRGHIFLNSGGGDAQDALVGILQRLVTVKELTAWPVVFHTVAGRFHPNIKALEELAASYPQIKLYTHVTQMAAVMGQCEIAVSAAGTVLYELSAMAVPTIFFVTADNQEYDSEFFAAQDRMIFAGDIRTSREECIEAVAEGIRRLLAEDGLRHKMREQLRQITDGQGAPRIARAIRDCLDLCSE